MTGGTIGMRRWAPLAALVLAGCNTRQSAFSVFGAEAAAIRTLTVALVAGAIVIALGVAVLMRHAVRAAPGSLDHRGGMRMVLWLGAILPTIVLAALLLFALPAMRPRAIAAGDLRIDVTGEQFWWRVDYAAPGRAPVIAADEIRIPVGRPVLFRLTAGDVIHSFWIPGLAGKMDMIPGRINLLPVQATRAGRFRGACTEFCGLSHARMAFDVVAMPAAKFDRWLAREAAPATATAGAGPFLANGCGGCHAVRGLAGATGAIGPDLTHFGGRGALAAGTWPMTTAAIAGFIRDPHAAKPGARMPAFPQIAPAEAAAIATWLKALR